MIAFPHFLASPRMLGNSFRKVIFHIKEATTCMWEKQSTTMPLSKPATTQRSTLVLATLWILFSQASNSDGSDHLNLNWCSPSVKPNDIYYASPDSLASIRLTDVTMEIDCSQPNQIIVSYPEIHHHRGYGITEPTELLLNCSSDGFQTESLCLWQYSDFGSTEVSGPYTLSDEDQNVILPGSTCFVSTCFTTDAYDPNYCAPPISCPHSPASSATVTSTTVLSGTTGESSIAGTHTVLKLLSSSIITATKTHTSTGESSIAGTPTVSKLLSSSIITATKTHTSTGRMPVNDTPTITTTHSWSTNTRVTVSTSISITDHETEFLEPDTDTLSEQTGILLLLSMILGAAAVIILMLMILIWIWCLKARRSKNKIFFVYNKNDMVFDPYHAPVSVETPAGFQHEKMSVVSMDALQSLNPKNKILVKEQIQITSMHESQYKSNIPSNMLGNQSSVNTSAENGDSDDRMYNGQNGVTQYRMTTCSSGISDCELPTLNENNCKELAVISLDDNAMGSDVFSIHAPVSTQDSLPGPSYCHLDSRYIRIFSPQKTVQTEKLTDLDSNDLGLEDSTTLDECSNDSANAGQHVHTNMLSHTPESENNVFPSSVQSEGNLKPTFLGSWKGVDNEQKVTDPSVTLSEDALENLSEDKASMLYSSSKYVQSHVATSKSWNVELLLTHDGDHYEDDIALDLTTEHSHISDEHSMERTDDVYDSSEYFPPLHFTCTDEITHHKSQSNEDNSDMKSNEGYLPDDSLHTSSFCTGSQVGLHLQDNAMMVMDDSVMEVVSISSSEGIKPHSRCSSHESGYYGYVPSFDLEPFNGNALHTTATGFNNLTLDNNTIPHQ